MPVPASVEDDKIPPSGHRAKHAPLLQIYQSYLDKATPYTTYRWIGTAVLLTLFFIRILLAQGWYIGPSLVRPSNHTLQPSWPSGKTIFQPQILT